MNKSKRMAILKHRKRRKKLEERRKMIALAGVPATAAKQAPAVAVAKAPPAPKKPVAKKKAEAVAAKPKAAKAKAAAPKAKAVKAKAAEAAPKKPAAKKKAEAAPKAVAAKPKAKVRKAKAGGCYTEEIRTGGARQGFRIVTLDDHDATLSHVDFPGRYRVSKYGVNVQNLDNVGVAAIDQAIEESDLIVIDEIGKMELFSPHFREAVLKAVDSGKKVLGTIMLSPTPFTV